MKLDDALQTKYRTLRDILRSLDSVVVAFSAGVDSTLLLKVAVDVLGRDRVTAATGRSASLPQRELEQACRLAGELGARHVVLDTDEFESEDYVSNPTNRCYFCKNTLYTHLDRYIRTHGIAAIASGINADDHDDWRPGIQAAGEHRVHAPLAEAGLAKAEVRRLARMLNLPTHDKPASPCLSSRVQYGERITPHKLRMIEDAEALLRSLGLRECRVRHHDNLARVEVPPEDIARLAEPQLRQRIDTHLRRLGYQYVTLDLRGFRSGSMNEVIEIGINQAAEQGLSAAAPDDRHPT